MLKVKISISLATLLAVLALAAASSQVRYIGNAVHKDYPGMCYHNDTQTPIAIGDSFYPTTECVEITCREDFVLRLVYCPRYMLGEGCTVTREEGAPHPDCCAKITCPERG